MALAHSGVWRRRGRSTIFSICVLVAVGSLCHVTGEERRPVVLPESLLTLLAGEVDGQAAYRLLGSVSTYHRMLGSDDMRDVIARLHDTVRRYGLRDVRIESVPVATGRERFWLQDMGGQVPATVKSGELRLVQPFPRLIASTEGVPSLVVQGSRSADVTAPVILVEDAANPDSYANRDVAGKLVLGGNGSLERIKELAIHQHGALGVLYYRDRPGYSGDDDDANLGLWWWPWSETGADTSFGFSLSRNQARFLKSLLDGGNQVVVRARIEAQLETGGKAAFEILDAAIPGAGEPDEEFWLVAHIDHPYPGATDNASGVATVLEVARTLQALIDQRLVPPPQRTIRFLLVPHVAGLSMYLSRHQEKLGRVRGALSIDNVGLDQQVFSNYFAVYKPSAAIPSYWDAVLESLVEHLSHRTNRDPLAWDDHDNLFAPEGTRQQFHVRLQPYTGGGDEFQLNHGTVGIPTMAFGSAPVPARHSQVNDARYVDPTALKRTAYLAAALAATFGWTNHQSAARLIDEVFYRGRQHLIRDAAKAARAVAEAPREELPLVRRRAEWLLGHRHARESASLASLQALVPRNDDASGLLQLRTAELSEDAERLRRELQQAHRRRCGQLGCEAVAAPLSPTEVRLDSLVPMADPSKRGTTSYFGDYFLHTLGREGLARFNLRPGFDYGIIGYAEARNFVDGRRSILDIYAATTSELWSEGVPATHDIALEELERYMRMLEAAKLITIEARPAGG